MRPTTLRSQVLGAALMAAICSGAPAQESAAIDPDLSDLLAPVDDEEAADDDWADLIADDEPKDVDASELAALSLEDLMGLDFQVTSVSRKSESLQATAAAVRADFRLGWRPTDGVTVTLAGQGLLHDDEQELPGRVGVSPYGAQAGGYLALRFNL